jgi:hypothetical protein
LSRECLNCHTLISYCLIGQELVELLHCFLQSLVPYIVVVRETIYLSLSDPPRAVDSEVPDIPQV